LLIADVIVAGKLILSRCYDAPGGGILRFVTLIPKEARYRQAAVAGVVAGKKGQELRAAVEFQYPSLAGIPLSELSQKRVKEEVARLVDSLPEAEKELADTPLPTGVDKSIAALLPEVIYIPAVKDLADDLKTAESASFGKLIGMLFQSIQPQLSDLDKLFGFLQRQLNVVVDNGEEVDDRLGEVVVIERAIEKNLQEAADLLQQPDQRAALACVQRGPIPPRGRCCGRRAHRPCRVRTR
jgi:putative ATP-dependent endonuclease of the OLD family